MHAKPSQCPLGELVGRKKPFNRYYIVETASLAQSFFKNRQSRIYIVQCSYCHCYHNITLRSCATLLYSLSNSVNYEQENRVGITIIYRKEVYTGAVCENPSCTVCT